MEFKRLIDADKIMDELRDYAHRKLANGLIDTANGILSAVIYIRNNVTRVDAVEVVRCRDCKHLVLTSEGEHNPCDCVCDYWMTDGLNDNDFCSYGERKYGDGNG